MTRWVGGECREGARAVCAVGARWVPRVCVLTFPSLQKLPEYKKRIADAVRTVLRCRCTALLAVLSAADVCLCVCTRVPVCG